MKELVVISGKGGTGKTSVVASFAALADSAVLADCDVDAADLYLVLSPRVLRREEFRAGRVARIRRQDCSGCGVCLARCRFGAVKESESSDGKKSYSVDEIACEGCGVCVWSCPEEAIDFPERTSGEWYISETRYGPMAHARLGIAEENSGKLVSLIRREAKRLAEEKGRKLVIADGSPGIGCPVIASIAGADMVLIVAEPTVSGLHDLQRAAELASKMRVPAMVCVNKSDLNPEMTAGIEEMARSRGLDFVGCIPYDDEVTRAQIEGKSVVEASPDGAAGKAVRALWSRVEKVLASGENAK